MKRQHRKKRKKKMTLRLENIAALLTVCLAVIPLADAVRRDMFFPSTLEKTGVDGAFPSSAESRLRKSSRKTDSDGEGAQYIGSFEVAMKSSQLAEGLLAIADNTHPIKKAKSGDLIDLVSMKNEYYSIANESLVMSYESAWALNELMYAYAMDTGLSDFVVYSTTEQNIQGDSLCRDYFPESVSGNTFDVAVLSYGEMVAYDGSDTEKWLVEHCYEYGFIVRYPEGKENFTGHEYCPWHIRYVGKAHSYVMHNRDMCLEEYMEFIKNYTVEKPYSCQAGNGIYNISYTPALSDETGVKVPINGNYTISGNNKDGFIVTVLMNVSK